MKITMNFGRELSKGELERALRKTNELLEEFAPSGAISYDHARTCPWCKEPTDVRIGMCPSCESEQQAVDAVNVAATDVLLDRFAAACDDGRREDVTDALVERAARCAFAQDAEAHGNPIGWDMAPSDIRDDYREHVRAVLAAAFNDGRRKP